jgi:hypothetical protein
MAVHRSYRRRARRQLWFLAAAAMLLAACSNGDDGAAGDTTTTRPGATSSSDPTTTSAPETSSPSLTTGDDVSEAEQEVIDRYVGFWEARFAANTGTPNPDDPALAEYATGAQLDTVIAETRQRRDDGLALRPAAPHRTAHSVRVVSVTGDRAEVQDCFVNDGVVYRVASGEVIDDSIVTRSVSAVMIREADAWRVERTMVLQEWEGVAGCALAG